MSHRPAYFQGKPTGPAPGKRSRKNRDLYVGVKDDRNVTRILVAGGLFAFALGVFGVVGYPALHEGRFGVSEKWHGQHWRLVDLGQYLRDQGVLFAIQGDAVRLPSENAQTVQLQFEGYADALAAAEQESDPQSRHLKVSAVQRAKHAVHVMRYDAAPTGATVDGSPADAYYGANWTWGRFVFRGDPTHIYDIQSALGEPLTLDGDSNTEVSE